jgi:hypothetical protein
VLNITTTEDLPMPSTFEYVDVPCRTELISPQMKTVWHPGQSLVVENPHMKLVTAKNGIHAQRTWDYEVLSYWINGLMSLGLSKTCLPIIGEVYMWGEVVEGDVGWISSHAYPKKVYVPTERFLPSHIESEVSRYDVMLTLEGFWEPFRQADRVAESLRVLYGCEAEAVSYMGVFPLGPPPLSYYDDHGYPYSYTRVSENRLTYHVRMAVGSSLSSATDQPPFPPSISDKHRAIIQQHSMMRLQFLS